MQCLGNTCNLNQPGPEGALAPSRCPWVPLQDHGRPGHDKESHKCR